jgi:hypothetical protein
MIPHQIGDDRFWRMSNLSGAFTNPLFHQRAGNSTVSVTEKPFV